MSSSDSAFFFFFSSSFSVALFFFSHRLAFRPGFLHKRAGKSPEKFMAYFFQIVAEELHICDDVVR